MYRLRYTIKYRNCDLNDIPAALLNWHVRMCANHVGIGLHTLEVFILCKRIRIENRWDKSPKQPLLALADLGNKLQRT
jgi:hypothetical protein